MNPRVAPAHPYPAFWRQTALNGPRISAVCLQNAVLAASVRRRCAGGGRLCGTRLLRRCGAPRARRARSAGLEVGRNSVSAGHLEGCRVSAPEMLWALHPGDVRCHTVAAGDLHKTEMLGYAESLCGAHLPDAGLESAERPWGELCLPCVIGATADLSDLGPNGHGPIEQT